MLQKITGTSLVLVFVFTTVSCAQKQVDVSNPVTQAEQKVDDARSLTSKVDKILSDFALPPIVKEVLTTEQLLMLPDQTASLNLTDKQVEMLDAGGFSFLDFISEESRKYLSDEQLEAIRRGNDPKITEEQEAIFSKMHQE